MPTVGASVPRKIAAGLIGLIALVSLSFAAVTGWLTPRFSVVVEGSTRGVLAAIAVALGFTALRVLMKQAPPKPKAVRPYQPDVDWLARLQKTISEPRLECEPGALVAFIDLITEPSDYRSRVVETIDLDGHNINKRVSIEFVLPSNVAGCKSLYLPILQPTMGDLVDNFRLTDGSGSSVTNLSYLETVELAAIGLRALLLSATGKPYREWVSTRAAELVLLELIARRHPSDVKSVESNIKKGLKRLEGTVTNEAKAVIGAYLRSLCAGYPIVAAVPRDLVVSNRILLRYERTVIPAAHSAGFMGKVRVGLGVRPSQITIPVDLAMTAGSYHLRINGPAEKYVVEQILRCFNCRERLVHGPESLEPDRCKHIAMRPVAEDTHFRLRGRYGQNFTHLYMRGYSSQRQKGNRYEILVRFNETPPGSRASATVTALAALLFIWVIGHLISDDETVSNSDLPAILLALPAIAASWFGLASGGEALVGSSLHARLSLIITGSLSVTAMVIYILQSAAISTLAKHHSPQAHMTLVGVSNVQWVIMLVIAFMSFIYISWHLLARVRNYMSLTSRSDPLTRDHFMV